MQTGKNLFKAGHGGSMEFVFESSVGSAGVLIIMWKKNIFSVVNRIQRPRYILLVIKFPSSDDLVLLGNVFGPNDIGSRGDFFSSLEDVVSKFAGGVIIGVILMPLLMKGKG